jgi:hypothetical protein
MEIKSRLRQLLKESIEGNYGYHVGNLTTKSEFIGEKAFGGRSLALQGFGGASKTGQFGAGHFLFGTKEKAEDFRKTKDRPIYKVDFGQYRMYRPSDAKEFVEGVINLTNQLIMVPEGFAETQEFNDVIDDLAQDLPSFGITLSRDKIFQITKGFVEDVTEMKNPKSDYLITRYLKSMGYEGLDLRNTPYDSYYIGSVIYDLKANTVSEA